MWSLGILLFVLVTGKVPHSNHKANLIQTVKSSSFHFNIKEIKDFPRYISELLVGLLENNPEKRFSAAQALQNPWLQKYFPANTLSVNFVRAFASPSLSSLKKAVLVFVCKYFLENQIVNDLSKYFKQIDIDKNGTIEREELKRALRCKFNEIQAETISEKFFSSFDENNNGVIDYTEFLTGVCGFFITDEHLARVFKVIGKEDTVTLEELSQFSGVSISELENLCVEKVLNFSAFKSLLGNLT